MQYVKVFKSGSIVVTSHFKLSMSFLGSLASVVEFLNQISEEKSSLLKLVELIIKTNGNCRTHLFHICYDVFLFIQT